jgi:hypothetical protein
VGGPGPVGAPPPDPVEGAHPPPGPMSSANRRASAGRLRTDAGSGHGGTSVRPRTGQMCDVRHKELCARCHSGSWCVKNAGRAGTRVGNACRERMCRAVPVEPGRTEGYVLRLRPFAAAFGPGPPGGGTVGQRAAGRDAASPAGGAPLARAPPGARTGERPCRPAHPGRPTRPVSRSGHARGMSRVVCGNVPCRVPCRVLCHGPLRGPCCRAGRAGRGGEARGWRSSGGRAVRTVVGCGGGPVPTAQGAGLCRRASRSALRRHPS